MQGNCALQSFLCACAMDPPLAKFSCWGDLRPELRDALVREDITTATEFHSLWNGEPDRTLEIAADLGGSATDVDALLAS